MKQLLQETVVESKLSESVDPIAFVASFPTIVQNGAKDAFQRITH